MGTSKTSNKISRKKTVGRSKAEPAVKKRKTKPRRVPAEPSADMLASALFPSLKTPSKPARLGAFLAVADRIDDKPIVRFTRREIAQTRSGRPCKRSSAVMSRDDIEQAAQMLAGLAHADRLQIAQTILLGANTHKALEQETQLKAGPLYHHIRSLERAGIVRVVARNTYRLTDAGQTGLLVISALAGGSRQSWRRIALREGEGSRSSGQ